MIQFIGTVFSIILSIFIVCIYFRFMKRAFDTFTTKDEFLPYHHFDRIISIMTIQVWAIVLAFFLGPPILQFPINDYTEQLILISVVIIMIAVMRLINIVYPRAVNYDIVVWSCAAVGILAFTLFTIPDFISNALSKIISLNQQQFQVVSLMVCIGTFLISISVELIGKLYKRIDYIDNSRS